MIIKLTPNAAQTVPCIDEKVFSTESDVEQKYILPFLHHASFLNLPLNWIRAKEYMSPTELDKRAGKKHGYLVGITTDTAFSFSKEVAEDIARIWTSQTREDDISLASKIKIAEILAEYFKAEYERRCKRHAFYEEFGRGGRALVQASIKSLEHLQGLKQRPLR